MVMSKKLQPIKISNFTQLYTFHASAVRFRDKLHPLVEENIGRTIKSFLLGQDNTHDNDYSTTFIFMIKCPNRFL